MTDRPVLPADTYIRRPAGQLAADIIAKALEEGLIHPGNPLKKQPPTAIPMPMFRTMGMPEQMVRTVRATTRMMAEAIVHDLQADGRLRLVTGNEADEERHEAANNEQPAGMDIPRMTIACPHGKPVLEVVPRPYVRLRADQLAAVVEAAKCQNH
jgi:hypothetical protein